MEYILLIYFLGFVAYLWLAFKGTRLPNKKLGVLIVLLGLIWPIVFIWFWANS